MTTYSSDEHERGPLITRAEAQLLLEYLVDGYQEEADAMIVGIVNRNQADLFSEVGKMARNLHDEISNFTVDPRLKDIAETEIPDATERLRYIIKMTDNAANRTMDAVDQCKPLADKLDSSINAIMPLWERLMRKDIDKSTFVRLCHGSYALLQVAQKDANTLNNQLTEILMAQDFQDLTGQMINRIIKLVGEVEGSLLAMLKAYAGEKAIADSRVRVVPSGSAAEGPIHNPDDRDDVARNQDDVDDLLASLGF